MCAATAGSKQRKYHINSARPHDYLYDSAYIVSGARDYARTTFKAAMMSSQVIIQPVYKTMFSELRKIPRMHVVYYPNCRLPPHMDTSYKAYLAKVSNSQNMPTPDMTGKDRFKFSALPKKVLDLNNVSPDFHPPSPAPPLISGKPRNRGTQSVYRESSAQTIPWQPDGKTADTCETTPEVLYLDKLDWGPGKPYRLGDLPADFHTTEIINKMRHARIWSEIAERGPLPRWMKKRNDIIGDIETKDWIFRQAEIDELQEIRITLLQKLQSEQREKQKNRNSKKLHDLWNTKKMEMERKIDMIRRNRDRELRKLAAIHSGGGRQGLCQRNRAMRGMGSPSVTAADPTSDVYALVARHGYQARTRHADITYDPSLLLLEDHNALAELPPWLEQCGQNLTKTCSGHALPKDPMKLCERETKWSEKFLEKIHNDLKKARLGAAGRNAGPLRILKPRRLQDTPRPVTPEVEAVTESDETDHQAALFLQKLIKGRAVQCLMYEGRTRAAELTEELKTTHGLQKEDKIRIAKEESKSRDYTSIRTEAEKKEDAITALVDELCGGAVSAALDFLEKELKRLKEERRQHAFIMIAMREKEMREATEAGRRQKEEHRRREHDEMFKQVLGVTQDTVDSYLKDIIREGIALSAEEEAVRYVLKQADKLEVDLKEQESMSTAEQNELVAELVQQFLLPSAHKAAAQLRIQELQKAKLEAARKVIFGLLDEAEIRKPMCVLCGTPDELCRCRVCPADQQPRESENRDDPRWKATRTRPCPKSKHTGQRYPPTHEFRCMLDCLIDEVGVKSRKQQMQRDLVRREYGELLRENVEKELEARDIVQEAFNIATGEKILPIRKYSYHHFSRHIRGDAIERTERATTCLCPEELSSKIREKALTEALAADPTCHCDDDDPSKPKRDEEPDMRDPGQRIMYLPSEVRAFEDKRKCKCDVSPDDSQAAFGIDISTSEISDDLLDIEEIIDMATKSQAGQGETQSDEEEI